MRNGTASTSGDAPECRTILLRVENGYAYLFSFSDAADHPRFADFELLAASVEYPELPEGGGHGTAIPGPAVILLALLVNGAPAAVCRFAVWRRPISRRKAGIAAAVYGLAAFLALALLLTLLGLQSGIGVTGLLTLIWGFVNREILSRGEAPRTGRGQSPGPGPDPARQVRFCPFCDRPLSDEGAYCARCGARIDGQGP